MAPEGSSHCHDPYPLSAVIVSNAVSISTYAIGAYLMFRAGIFWMFLYVAFVVALEIRLLKYHCVDCTYYGKVCAFGKGKISAFFFPRGDPGRFCGRKITWIDILPDFLVSLVPMGAGILLLTWRFDWVILILVIILFLLGFVGNGLVRGLIACRFCRQRELGCPAEQLFGKPQP
ncbi:MAG: hypothetical protein LUQ41_02290 [Methanomicrobiales archaeon]|nr:hypothetical protein [Methanomicrobiales archaeon]